jgi:acetyltransferase-like isoleucine patch superfamily enzyme
MIKKVFRNLLSSLHHHILRQSEFKEKLALMKQGLLVVGTKSYGHFQLIIDNYKGSEQCITIGNYTSIAPGVRIITGGIHPTEWVSLFPFRINYQMDNAHKDGTPRTKGPVNIGSDVWIATGVTIISGVSIGNGAVIYNNTLVNKNIPSYAIAGGIPAKIIGYRFTPEIIAELEKIEWWNWDEKQIIEAVPMLSSGKVDEFIKRYKK